MCSKNSSCPECSSKITHWTLQLPNVNLLLETSLEKGRSFGADILKNGHIFGTLLRFVAYLFRQNFCG